MRSLWRGLPAVQTWDSPWCLGNSSLYGQSQCCLSDHVPLLRYFVVLFFFIFFFLILCGFDLMHSDPLISLSLHIYPCNLPFKTKPNLREKLNKTKIKTKK